MHNAPLSAAWSWGWDLKVGALQLELMLPMPPWSGEPRELNLIWLSIFQTQVGLSERYIFQSRQIGHTLFHTCQLGL